MTTSAETGNRTTGNEISDEQPQGENVPPGGKGQTTPGSLENFKVAVRLRPFTERERQRQSKRIVDIEHNTVALYNPKWPDDATKRFTFDLSYWSHDGFRRNHEGVNVPDPAQPNCAKYVDQERVFEDLGRFLLENAVEGYNSALLAYGQTGSGKSYTVSGYGQNEGILPRFARELFAELERRLPGGGGGSAEADKQSGQSEGAKTEGEPVAETSGSAPTTRGRFEVYFSMIEIYNEVVRDLLAKQGAAGAAGQKGAPGSSSIGVRRGLRVREHPKRGFFVESLSSYQCSSEAQIEGLIEEGQLNKSIAATSMNETSSRGHTIYEFHIKQFRPRDGSAGSDHSGASPARPRPLPLETMTSSVVQLVDLAGSERMTVHMASASDLPPARPHSRSGSPMVGAAGQLDTTGGGSSSSMTRSRSVRNLTNQTPGGGGGGGSRRAQNQPAAPASAAATSSKRSAASQNGGASGNLLGAHLDSQRNQQRFKESVSINQSLSALGNCIQVLSQFSQQNPPAETTPTAATTNNCTKQPKIPYRDSVLTKLLNRCCLSGNSKVVLIATLSPADANYDDTLSTLRFADRAKQIRTHAVINRSVEGVAAGGAAPTASSDVGVTALQRENERLKQILDGRVTRSDDSSQTSNFDDSENMQENFQGPKASPRAVSPSRKSRRDRATTVVRPRATGSKAAKQTTTGGQAKAGKASAVQQGGAPAEGATGRGDSQTRQPGGSQGFRGRSQTIAAPPGTRLLAASGPNQGGDAEEGRQMAQLVSPAGQKMRGQRERQLSRFGTGSISLETEDADEDYQDDSEREAQTQADSSARKSVGGRNTSGSPAEDVAGPTRQFGSELLDEIDLNELANMIDDENPLSPDSDDSFNQSIARAKLDDNMSKREKAAILNRLLSNSNVATRIIRKQIEGSLKQVRLDRPKGAGASGKQHLRPVKRAELMGGASSPAEPCLSNLNSDEQLSSVITYRIGPGETIVGKDDSCDLLIFGPGLRGRHARLTRHVAAAAAAAGERESPAGQCFIEPIFDQDQEEGEPETRRGGAMGSKARQARRVALLVNGEPVSGRVRLAHGDRLLFGSAGYFVFLDEAAAAAGRGEQPPEPPATYDMAHAEVMRKMMSDTENEAMIREIKDYTHRPGTGRRERSSRDTEEVGAAESEARGAPDAGLSATGAVASEVACSLGSPPPDGAASDDSQEREATRPLDKIKEEEDGPHADEDPADLLYRDRLMADTHEFIIPTAEANAIAEEMSIRVTYGLKILTGEEQLEPLMGGDKDELQQWAAAMAGAEPTEGAEEAAEKETTRAERMANEANNVIISSEQPIKPETLDLPPELYIHVRLDELELDFYWTKEKFQERRLTMLELYGAWDVGGKSGLVEHLIEQSKYQGYYMADPFVDDLRSSWVLVGHAQVSLRPLSHAAPLGGRFDVIDVNDETVGSLSIEAVPCENEPLGQGGQAEWPYARRQAAAVLRDARQLLDKKLVFLLRIVSCSRPTSRAQFAHLFCQYTLNRDQPTIRTKLVPIGERDASHDAQDNHQELRFEHRHFVVVERVTQDILDFLQHGFLTIQLVGQYANEQQPPPPPAAKHNEQASAGSSKQVARSSAGSSTSRTMAQPTLVSAIISSINKYRYRMEQQSAALQKLQFQQSGDYANSMGTYSANSAAYRLHSNSGPSSVTSASNLFDGQPDDDDAAGLLNGAAPPNQENIIDMILTKRKLDRAENQLHYIKRTINIAEHHNKKHIPVRIVKKLLNSYGQELEGGGLEEMTAEVTAETTKTNNSKHSNCSIQ